MKTIPSLLVVSLSLFSAIKASASLIVVAPTGSTTGSLTITQDITFTITTTVSSDTTLYFALDNWVTYGNSGSFHVSYSPKLSISIDGGAPQNLGPGQFTDNYGSTFGPLTPGDGYFTISASPAMAVDDTLTLKAGSYTLGVAASDGFNPQATQTFTGNMFIYRGATDAAVLSNTVAAVPEPGSVTFACVGLAVALSTLRHRRRAV